MANEKIWSLEELLKEYIVEKVRRGYETRYTVKELVDYLDYISYYVKTTLEQSSLRYNEEVQRYLDKECEKLVPVIESRLTGVYRPTYQLHYEPKNKDLGKVPVVIDFSDYEFDAGLTFYLGRNGVKRTISTFSDVDGLTYKFAERTAASMIEHIWGSKIQKEIENRRWPSQCTNISRFIIETDLANIIGLPSMREELFDFFFTVRERLGNLAYGESDFRISNEEKELLAKSNFDLVMEGFPYFKSTGVGSVSIDLSRLLNLILYTVQNADGSVSCDELVNLNNPKILNLAYDIKMAKMQSK